MTVSAESAAIGEMNSSSVDVNSASTEIKQFSEEFHLSLAIGNETPSSDSNKYFASSSSKIEANEDSHGHHSESTSNHDALYHDKRFIAPKDFELLKVIGMGAFGKVLQVRSRKSHQILAMKVISKRLLKRKTAYVENVLAERNILKRIGKHPFIVTMHASFQTKEKLFIVMDFCAGGELFLKLGREGIFLERTAAFYLAEITLALEHLHSMNVLHRDLKPENILLGSDGHCCLTDFGLAKDFTGLNSDNDDERARTLCGTMEYMAPEMVARKWYGKGADFWSVGCIAYEMLHGKPPFSSKKGSKEMFRKIMNERIRMPNGASDSACKLLKGLLNRDPTKRLGASKGTMFEVGGVGALKQQPFFYGLDWGKLELKELAPPEDFSVSSDEDLRYFHEEFTQMTLPRSVKEMSKVDFLPRHCKSDEFRGFSFICDQFPLPERCSAEEEHYWNNVDNDGQSVSDCASSIFDDDLGEKSIPEPAPEKKKRPPNKKKKKQTIPMETAVEDEEKLEQSRDEENSFILGCEEKKENEQIHMVDIQSGSIVEDSRTFPVVVKMPNSASNEPTIINSKNIDVISAITKKGATITSSPLGVDAKVSSATLDVKPTVFVSNMTAVNAKSTFLPDTKVQPKTLMPSPSAVRLQTSVPNAKKDDIHVISNVSMSMESEYKPKPGTWASIAHGKSSTAKSPMLLNFQAPSMRPHTTSQKISEVESIASKPIQQAKNLAESSSLDWRCHVVSPRKKPPISQPEQNNATSLTEFPPPPGMQVKRIKETSMGAWGAKKF